MATPEPLPFGAGKPSLADFIPGGNGELLAAVRALAQGAASVASLYIWGGEGAGKSALLAAACTEARRSGQAAYLVRDGEVPPPAGGLLAVDDVGDLEEEAQITLFDWHNCAAAGGHLLLAAGNAAPTALPLREELTSRLSAGLVFRLRALSDREKSQALAVWARQRGFTLDAPIAEVLLTQLPRNMHTLTAALGQLDEFLLRQKKPLTARIARLWLAQTAPADAACVHEEPL